MVYDSHESNQNCYIVSVKVQFFCLPIGQNRIYHVPVHKMSLRALPRKQPVHNETLTGQ
jgi:hypothetical protein